MDRLELVSPLKPYHGSQEDFAEELSDDLQGNAVEVVHVMIEDTYYLARPRDDADE